MTTIYAIAAAVFGLIVFIVGVARKARQFGVNETIAKKAKDDAQLQMQFDEIDSRAPDLDGAVARLRDRGKRSKAGLK